jgi:hypothetical protein
MLIQDDARAELPPLMMPGDRQEVHLDIAAPEAPALYTCQVDVVHEGVTWFGDRGSATLEFKVAVGVKPSPGTAAVPGSGGSGSGSDSGSDSGSYPDIYAGLESDAEPAEFPMFGLQLDTVKMLMAESGAEMILAEPDERGGLEWVGYRYFVSKPLIT